MPGTRLRLRDVARYIPFALLGGAFIGFLMRGMRWELGSIIGGAIIGVSCMACALLAEHFLHDWFDRHPGQWWRRAIVYFVASQIGWMIPLFVLLPIVGGRSVVARVPRTVFVITLLLGVAGTGVGLAVYGYEKLKERLARSIEELKEKEFAEKELELARELQARMMPAQEIAADGYRVTSRNFAARYVAGDFYDVFPHADGAVGIALADVAGKGLAASLIMASVKSVLPLLASMRTVSQAMHALNEKLLGELSKREFVALALARYDPATGRASISNAGVPDPYVIRKDGSVEVVSVGGVRLPLGMRRGVQYDHIDVDIRSGDALLFVSDGLPEAALPNGEPIGYDALAGIIRAAGASIERILAGVEAAGTREDDQTIVLLERL